VTVVVDTSLLAAAVNQRDPDHASSQALMDRVLAGEQGRPVTSEHVLDEGLTLLRRRPGRPEVSDAFATFFFGDEKEPPPIRLVLTTWADVVAAYRLHQQHYERGLSFTDCILASLADSLDAPIASLDHDFDGIVPRIAPS